MERLSLSEIASATGGRLNNSRYSELYVYNVVTDSRDSLENALFVPIRGTRFDGHNFIGEAFEKGAVCVLSEETTGTGKPAVYVSDTKKALCMLAEYYRSLFEIPVVAVTGSAGKTTTKDLIHSVLSVKYKTLKNQGNFNNEIGLPLTIFQLDNTYEAAVLEMGMSGFSEIHNLSKIARPRIAVITNIGDAHIEMLGNRENIFKAKCEVFDFLASGGSICVNGDDGLLASLKHTHNNVVFYGKNSQCHFYPSSISPNGLLGMGFVINSNEFAQYVDVPSPGWHMVYNVLAAAAVGSLLNITPGEIAKGVANFQAPDMRMNIFTSKSGIIIINDAYNANPSSMKAAIDVLAASGKKTVCILGDMLELGNASGSLHFDVGRYAAEKQVDTILCAGNHAKHIYDGAQNAINTGASKSSAFYFNDRQALSDKLKNFIFSGNAVLIKASRGMGFEEIIKHID